MTTFTFTLRGVVLSAAACVLLLRTAAHADFTTSSTVSLEWLVHSSDAIYLVRSNKPVEGDDAWSIDAWSIHLEKTLREPGNGLESVFPAVQEAKVCGTAKDGDQWLAFVRTWEDKPPNVFYWVNLTRPLECVWTAPINAQGIPLTEKADILRTVEARLRMNRQLSSREKRCRERVDRGAYFESPYPERHSLEHCLGGFLIPIDLNLWDNPSATADKVDYVIKDHDLGLWGLVVPADPEYYEALLATAGADEGGPACGRSIIALINYPCPQTDEVLEKIRTRKGHVWDPDPRSEAEAVAWYFRYRRDLSDPLHRELLGRWRLDWHQERIDVDLLKGGRFVATAYDRSEAEPKQLWRGRGDWLLHERTLTLYRDGRLVARSEQQDKSPQWYYSPRMIFEEKAILKFSAREVTLKDGPVMTRLEDPTAGD